jgi:predicted transcriptional regulator
MAQQSKPNGRSKVNAEQLVYERQSQICKAFAHPVRLQILDLLAKRQRYVSELLEELGISKTRRQATVLHPCHAGSEERLRTDSQRASQAGR